MKRILTFIAFAVIFLAVLMCSCKPCSYSVTETPTGKYEIVCDTVTVNDSSFFEPTFFKFSDHTILHTYNGENFTFRVIETAGDTIMAYCTCNKRTYVITHNISPGGFIQFTDPERTIRFRILNIIKQ